MSKKVLDLPGAGLLRATFFVGCLAVLASCGGGVLRDISSLVGKVRVS